MKKSITPSRSRSTNTYKTTEATFHSLLRTLGLLRQIMEPYFGRFGISGPQWGVLRVLQRAELSGDGRLRLKDVSDRLLIRPPSVSAVVDRLERQGLVKRSGSASDLRVRKVGLTPEGRKLMARVLERHTAQVNSLFGGLSDAERRTLFQLLGKVESRLTTLANN